MNTQNWTPARGSIEADYKFAPNPRMQVRIVADASRPEWYADVYCASTFVTTIAVGESEDDARTQAVEWMEKHDDELPRAAQPKGEVA